MICDTETVLCSCSMLLFYQRGWTTQRPTPRAIKEHMLHLMPVCIGPGETHVLETVPSGAPHETGKNKRSTILLHHIAASRVAISRTSSRNSGCARNCGVRSALGVGVWRLSAASPNWWIVINFSSRSEIAVNAASSSPLSVHASSKMAVNAAS